MSGPYWEYDYELEYDDIKHPKMLLSTLCIGIPIEIFYLFILND